MLSAGHLICLLIDLKLEGLVCITWRIRALWGDSGTDTSCVSPYWTPVRCAALAPTRHFIRQFSSCNCSFRFCHMHTACSWSFVCSLGVMPLCQSNWGTHPPTPTPPGLHLCKNTTLYYVVVKLASFFMNCLHLMLHLILRYEDLEHVLVHSHAETAVITLHCEALLASSCFASTIQPLPHTALLSPGRPHNQRIHHCNHVCSTDTEET